MCYVAVDPEQHDAAWAICEDDPKRKKDVAKDVARWIEEGSNVMRVRSNVAIVMFEKWVRKRESLELLFSQKRNKS